MKKIITLLLAGAVTLSATAVSVFADYDIWSFSCTGAYADNHTKYSAEITETAAYEGKYGAYFVCNIGTAEPDSFVQAETQLKQTLTDGSYTIEYYGRPEGRSEEGIIVIGGTELDTSLMTKESVGGGWSKYSTTFDYTAGENNSTFTFKFSKRITGYSVDNISLIPADGGINMLADPDFEEFYEVIDDSEPYDTAPYQPTKMLMSKNDGVLALSWVNPQTPPEKISIYDTTDGAETLLADNLSTSANAIVYHKISGLSEEVNYTYKIVFSFEGKSDFVYYMSGMPGGSQSKKIGGWTAYENRTGPSGFCPAAINVAMEDAETENAAVKMVSNINGSEKDGMHSNIYLRMDQRAAMEIGTTYRISFRIKYKNLSGGVQAHMNWNRFNGLTDINLTDAKGTSDWKDYVFEYTYGVNDGELKHEFDTFVFLVSGSADELWLDDVACVELTEAGGEPVTGENLFSDGDFEELLAGSKKELDAFSAVADTDCAELKWEASDITGINIYQKVFDKYEFRGRIESGVSSLNISGLTQGETYSFRAAPYDALGVEGVAMEASADIPVRDIVAKPVLTKGTEEVDELSGPGVYTLTVSAKNNTKADGLPYSAIAVLYDETGTKVEVYSIDATVSLRPVNAPYSSKSVSITVPDDKDYSLKVFVFDTRELLNRYYGKTVY